MHQQFLHSKTSKQFTMTVFDESKVENIGGKKEPRRTELSWQIPEGIIDFWRLNANYTSLLLSMKIDGTSNEESSYLIREAVATSRNHKQEHLEADIHELISQDREMEVDIDNDEDDIDIVYTWRTTKLPLSAIAQKHRQPTAKVVKVIGMYKSMVWQQVESISRRATKSRRKIDDKRLEKIREYWLRGVHHQIYMEDVKRTVWNHASITKPPTNQTIAKAMKSEVKTNYRILSTRHPKTFSSDSKRMFLEVTIVKITLCNN